MGANFGFATAFLGVSFLVTVLGADFLTWEWVTGLWDDSSSSLLSLSELSDSESDPDSLRDLVSFVFAGFPSG